MYCTKLELLDEAGKNGTALYPFIQNVYKLVDNYN
jgi:hypothetical protein